MAKIDLILLVPSFIEFVMKRLAWVFLKITLSLKQIVTQVVIVCVEQSTAPVVHF